MRRPRKIHCRSAGLWLATFSNFAAHRAEVQRCRLVNLPVDFHAELNVTTRVGRDNPAKPRIAKVCNWRKELRMIGDVERLGTELNPKSFAPVPPFLDAKISGVDSRGAQVRHGARRVAES